MFEEKKSFPWKIPAVVLVCTLVLSSGIYIGVKSRNDNPKTPPTSKVSSNQENAKEAFGLNENCEVWVHKSYNDNSDSKSSPVMIGTVPKELLDKSEDEIVAYFEEKYPNREVQNIGKYEIILTEVEDASVDMSKANKFSVESNSGFVGIYKYDETGKKTLVEETNIEVDSLPRTVQDELQQGLIVNSQDEAYSKLEDMDS
ncbi:MAG: hypothetical protein ACRDD7_09760 [Peptostreptococcaceae bacterium]